jgi:NTP pyrophosphatase (non-canonical NTP hydrolase)
MIEIEETIGLAAGYEMLAEEAAEVCHAALKLSRILRGDNPTPVSANDAIENLNEEYTDLINAARLLNMNVDERMARFKISRMEERLKQKKKGSD